MKRRKSAAPAKRNKRKLSAKAGHLHLAPAIENAFWKSDSLASARNKADGRARRRLGEWRRHLKDGVISQRTSCWREKASWVFAKATRRKPKTRLSGEKT
jgi:hypothetical protein